MLGRRQGSRQAWGSAFRQLCDLGHREPWFPHLRAGLRGLPASSFGGGRSAGRECRWRCWAHGVSPHTGDYSWAKERRPLFPNVFPTHLLMPAAPLDLAFRGKGIQTALLPYNQGFCQQRRRGRCHSPQALLTTVSLVAGGDTALRQGTPAGQGPGGAAGAGCFVECPEDLGLTSGERGLGSSRYQ